MTISVTNITKSGKELTDLFSYDFINNRKVYLIGEVTDSLAAEIISQLEYLDSNGTGDIKLYINSPGGAVTAGFAIVDAMNRCRCDVAAICTGTAASMGAFILSCGTKGKRYATPLSEIMIHQPLGGVQGQASDIELVAAHITQTKQKLNTILAENTGKPIEVISRDCDRDYYMTASQAKEYGIIDEILTRNLK